MDEHDRDKFIDEVMKDFEAEIESFIKDALKDLPVETGMARVGDASSLAVSRYFMKYAESAGIDLVDLIRVTRQAEPDED